MICSKCFSEKPIKEFVKQKSIKNGYRKVCKQCHSFYTTLQKYNITKEEYASLLNKFSGRCHICKTENPGGKSKYGLLHIEHCHKTNKIRGLVCNDCNKAICVLETWDGSIKELLNKTIEYINKQPFMIIDKKREYPKNLIKDPSYRYRAEINEGEKQCVGRYGCLEWLPLEKFYIKLKDKGHISSECKECNKIKYRWETYKITEIEYNTLLKKYNYKCFLCPSSNNLVIDHNFNTMEIRGILCSNCNRNLLPVFDKMSSHKETVKIFSNYLQI